MQRFFSFAVLLLAMTSLTSCLYKMPDEETIHTVPTTNNPNIIRDAGPSMTPGIDY